MYDTSRTNLGYFALILLVFKYLVFFFNDTATTEIYTLSLHDALPISRNMIRQFEAPRDLDASTNSFSRSESTWPRMIRATYGVFATTMMKMTTERPGWMRPPAQPS